jgi:hypothetical protein
MPRSLAVLLACGLLILSSLALATGAAAATIGPTVECNNAFGNGGAVCEVTIVNTITATGGSATVTVRECTGSAGVPETACTVTTDTLTEPVTAVTQCNGSVNGGGGVLRCSVEVVNNFVDIDPAEIAVTVNQCVGSGESGLIGATIVCDPFPATTTGATITQCNGSANGGTLVGLFCSATGTESAGLAVLINQCNDSANGGGTLVTCTADIQNNQVAGATPAPTPAPTATQGGGSTPTPVSTPRITPPTTDTTTGGDASGSGSIQVALLAISLVALIVLVATLRPAGAIRRR